MLDKERRCIEKARHVRLNTLKKSYDEAIKEPFDSPLNELIDLIKEVTTNDNRNRISIAKKIIAFFILFIFGIFLLVVTPFACVQQLWAKQKAKQNLKRKIKELKIEPLSPIVPDEKVLGALWYIHGLEAGKYSFDECLGLLNSWGDILYGKDVLNRLSLELRVEKIKKKHTEANRPYYEGENAPHLFFRPPIDVMIRELSEELPLYK